MPARFRPLVTCAAFTVFAATSIAHAQTIALSTASPTGLSGVNFENDSLIQYDPLTDVAAQLFDLEDEFGISRNLIAAHEMPNGNLIVSTQAGDTIGGVAFTESDLIELDRTTGTASLFFDASAVGLTGQGGSVPNIDAVSVLPNGLVFFSTRNDATLFGVDYGKEDLISYDPVAGTASLAFDGSLINGTEPNLRAAAILNDETLLFAASEGGSSDTMTIGGVTFNRDDLVIYNTLSGTVTLFMEGGDEFTGSQIVDAVTVVGIPEPATLGLAAIPLLALGRRRR
ncbi:MAG: PEP-CTERM sorting domain-containing protein [Planctomycetota bacterium]